MSKTPFLVATAVLGIAFVAGATKRVAAAEEAAVPSGHIICRLNGGTCTYNNNVGYWTGCVGGVQGSWINTHIAQIVCREFVSGEA